MWQGLSEVQCAHATQHIPQLSQQQLVGGAPMVVLQHVYLQSHTHTYTPRQRCFRFESDVIWRGCGSTGDGSSRALEGAWAGG